MGIITINLPADGSTADVSDYNTPITTITNEINGNLENANIKAGAAIDGSKLADDSITAAKLATGQVYRRQGGDASDWSVAGTTTYDVSATDVKIQAGSVVATSADFTITFPVAYTNKPLVFLSTNSASSVNAFPRYKISTITNTTVAVTLITDAGAVSTTESVAWLAMGV